MIPVLNAHQIREADAHTITSEPIASLDLMERAAEACTAWLGRHYRPGRTAFMILCGCGNNGGDGLAIARLLVRDGYAVRACLCRHRPELSSDAGANLARLADAGIAVIDLSVGSPVPRSPENEVLIDALLGSGLDRPVDGWLKELITDVNGRANEVIAIDMPTGLFTEDNSGNDPKAIIRADHVLTFEAPKLALLLPENGPFVGQWHRIPIGLDKAFIEGLGVRESLIELRDVQDVLPERPRFGHKGTFGHALLIAGTAGKVGAAILAARACVRSGAGLLTVQLPADLQGVMHVAVPEAMATTEALRIDAAPMPDASRYTAIGIGPGIGVGEDPARMLKLLIQDPPAPLVLDADALNILGENRTWLGFLPKGSILTPHPREFDRLSEKSATGFERLGKARAFAVRHRVVLVLKGADTAICSPDGKVFFNPTGNPGMAKGGSGDVLTGIITGLLAQGLDPLSAAIAGVYAHGLAGDLAAEQLGMDGMTPGDLIGHLPMAWRRIRSLS